MTLDRDIPDDDFWSTDEPAGTFSTWLFAGQDGLDRLSGASTFSSPTPSDFLARLTRVQLDHVALEGFAATAHRVSRTALHLRSHPTPLLTFVFLKAGRLRVELAEAAFDVEPGEFFIVDSGDQVTWTAETDVRMLTSVIGIEHVPTHLLSRGTTIPAPLHRTPLVDSFVAFQATILSASRSGRRAQGDQLIRAVAELHAAVLAEAQQMVGEPTGSAALRYRMEEHIDAHFDDPDLRPETVATAVGISLRHAHNVFNDGDRTIGRYIRDRRTEAVAFALRTSTARTPLPELAAQHGFVSVETMSRAFQHRYGMSITEYRAGGHRTFG